MINFEVNPLNQSQTDSLKLFTVMTKALQSVRIKAIADIKKHGFNPTEFAVLELLYSKDEQPVQKIGEKVLIASSSITYVVDKLEKKGWLSASHAQRIGVWRLFPLQKKGMNGWLTSFPAMLKQLTPSLLLLTRQKNASSLIN